MWDQKGLLCARYDCSRWHGDCLLLVAECAQNGLDISCSNIAASVCKATKYGCSCSHDYKLARYGNFVDAYSITAPSG